MPQLLERLEMLVVANDWKDVIAKMSSVGVSNKIPVSRRHIDGLFVIEVKMLPVDLIDEFYERIKTHPDISIIKDPVSLRRSEEVLKEIYEVETELRKLLLHVYDLVEVFYDMFSKTQVAKNFAKHKRINEVNQIDPLTSRLMFGEMIDILRFDLSWTKRDLSADDLLTLLEDATDLRQVRNALRKKLQPQRVWDVISGKVLNTPVEWHSIQEDMILLKDFRNRAAHFQVITPGEKNNLIKKARSLRSRLTKQKVLNQAQRGALDRLSKVYADSLNNSLTQIAEATQKTTEGLAGVFNVASKTQGIASIIAAQNELHLKRLNLLNDLGAIRALRSLNNPSSTKTEE